MKKLFLKSIGYLVLIILILEVIIRVFHLTKDYPVRFIDDHGVERWVPNQEGYSVTGNRRQNSSKFNINENGYNSFRAYKPSEDKVELALVGDSFIEGFHQDYYNSVGKKIENKLSDMEVYEYGYAGYDLADQLHLIHKYQAHFDLIDFVVIGLNFEEDLTRPEYGILKYRMKLESPTYRSLRKIKLLVYLQNIGAFTAVKKLKENLLSVGHEKQVPQAIEDSSSIHKRDLKYLNNFENLTQTYGFDQTRFILLLDQKHTPEVFLNHLKKNDYKYIDFGDTLNHSKIPTTLIYDQHWNNHGRTLIANLIACSISKERDK